MARGDAGRKGTFASTRLPLLSTLGSYQASWLARDGVAALSVWALLVPQGVAYASIAGVPPQYGLYTALFALLGYAVFGTSRQTVTGPSATVAAVSFSVVGLVAAAGAPQSDTWVAYTAALAVVAGLAYVGLGLLRMGWIANFLSTSVLEGFVFGFGIGLTIDQSHKILGVPKVEGSYVQMLVGTIRELPQTNYYTLAIGVVSIALLLLMRRFAPKWPRALIVVVLGIAASAALQVADYGVKIVGAVPTGLPTFQVPALSAGTIGTLVAGGFAVIMVGFSESLAAAKAQASKHDYEIDASQEMVAQGAANALAGLFGGFSVDGSLSKTTVADLAGQRTQVASVINAGLILLTVLFLAGLFTDLPEAVLGAVVIDAAIGLVKVDVFKRIRATSRRDFAAYIAAMLGLLFIGVLAGVLIGVILSLLLLIAAVSRSPVRRMAFDEADGVFVDAERFPEAVTLPGVLVVEIDGPLFFADAADFHTAVKELVAASSPHAVVIDFDAVTQIDLDGAEIIEKLHAELDAKGIRLVLARVAAEERELLERAGTLDVVGQDNVFVTVRAAASAVKRAEED